MAAGAMLAASPARADILEIAPDGSVTVIGARRAAPAEADIDLVVPDGALPSDAPVPAPAVPAPYAARLAQIAAANDISPALLEALVWQESRWRQDAISPAGAIGLAQLMPATARTLGVDPRDPVANLEGGARYLRRQLDLFDGDIEKALAAYNAGPARVLRAGGVPAIAETRTYVAAIVGRLTRGLVSSPGGGGGPRSGGGVLAASAPPGASAPAQAAARLTTLSPAETTPPPPEGGPPPPPGEDRYATAFAPLPQGE